jgi:hypothetical protein
LAAAAPGGRTPAWSTPTHAASSSSLWVSVKGVIYWNKMGVLMSLLHVWEFSVRPLKDFKFKNFSFHFYNKYRVHRVIHSLVLVIDKYQSVKDFLTVNFKCLTIR